MIKTWDEFFLEVTHKSYSKSLHQFLNDVYENSVCYPPKHLLFNAFDICPVDKVKVVIFGQDPYHEPNQAMGLCFSVNDGVKVPPSLTNIYKELEQEYNIEMDRKSGNLTYLAKQGVLMLNAILSVEKGKPMSHNIKEYKLLFKDVLTFLNELDQPIVFMLWGGPARSLKKYLTNPKHLILEANHPSPLAANRGGWFGCNHFKLCNEYLQNNGLLPINWANKVNLL